MEIKDTKEKKLTLQQQMRIDTRIFNAQSRVFAGELPDKIFKNGKEIDYLTVKANDLPIVERIQVGVICYDLNDFIAKVFVSKRGTYNRVEPIYKFKKIDELGILIRYRKGNEVEFFFGSTHKRDEYFKELINNRKIYTKDELSSKSI